MSLSRYSVAIEEVRTCKSEQDRLAILVESLAAVLDADDLPRLELRTRAEEIFESRLRKLVKLCQEEDALLAELEELRKDPENLK